MAIEFNGKRTVNNFKINNDTANAKEAVKEEKVTEQQQAVDNKFVKDMGEDLLTSTAASAYSINFTRSSGTKIDKDFWGDTLDGLNLKDTTIANNTVLGIGDMDAAFAVVDMENKMAKSPFMKALNNEFGIS